MARKIVNRKELRDAHDAAEARKVDADGGEDAVVKKPKAKRKSRAKVEKEVRLKAYWCVFNQALKRIAQFEYHERDQADKKVEELNSSQKTPHFVRLVKEAIE